MIIAETEYENQQKNVMTGTQLTQMVAITTVQLIQITTVRMLLVRSPRVQSRLVEMDKLLLQNNVMIKTKILLTDVLAARLLLVGFVVILLDNHQFVITLVETELNTRMSSVMMEIQFQMTVARISAK